MNNTIYHNKSLRIHYRVWRLMQGNQSGFSLKITEVTFTYDSKSQLFIKNCGKQNNYICHLFLVPF